MKKSFKKILYAFLIIPVLFIFTACKDSKTKQEVTGVRVSNVKVIFDIGEEFGLGSGKAEKQINKKTWSEISADVYTIDSSAYNKDVAGVYAINVSALEKTFTYSVVVLDKDLLTVQYNTAYEDIDFNIEGLSVDIADATAKVGALGNHAITLSYKATTDATPISIPAQLSVIKATIDYQTILEQAMLTATWGQTLQVIQLPEGFAFNQPTTLLEEVGEFNFKGSYTPADTTNYNALTDIDIPVKVNKAIPVYGIEGQTGVLGLPLSSIKLPEGFAWKEPSTIMSEVGDFIFNATFTPEDTEHYQINDTFVMVSVKQYDTSIVKVVGLNDLGITDENIEEATLFSDDAEILFNNTIRLDTNKFNDLIEFININFIREGTGLTDFATWSANTYSGTTLPDETITNIEKVYYANTNNNTSGDSVTLYAYKLADDENVYLFRLDVYIEGIFAESLAQHASYRIFDIVDIVKEQGSLKASYTSSIEIASDTFTKDETFATNGIMGYYSLTIYQNDHKIGVYQEIFEYSNQKVRFIYDGEDFTGNTQDTLHVTAVISYADYITCYNQAFTETYTDILEVKNLAYLVTDYFIPFHDLSNLEEPTWFENVDDMKATLMGIFNSNGKSVECYAQIIGEGQQQIELYTLYSAEPNKYYAYPDYSIMTGDFSDELAITLETRFEIQEFDLTNYTEIETQNEILAFVTDMFVVSNPQMFMA